MTAREINDIIRALAEHCNALEDAYVENEGEITEETMSMEDQIADLQEVLLGDGVDELGRWLKAKEDQKAALKAEKAKIDSMAKAVDRSIDYIKGLIDTILFACGQEQVKGLLYSFKRTVSTTHTANTDIINQRYLDVAAKAAHEAGLPEWVGISLKPSWALVPAGTETDEFNTVTKQTVTFRKPVKSKYNESE